MSQIEGGLKPSRKTNLALIWYHMGSFNPFAGNPATFGRGTARAEISRPVSTLSPIPPGKPRWYYESHAPGDFYAAGHAPAYEIQGQVIYSIGLTSPAQG